MRPKNPTASLLLTVALAGALVLGASPAVAAPVGASPGSLDNGVMATTDVQRPGAEVDAELSAQVSAQVSGQVSGQVSAAKKPKIKYPKAGKKKYKVATGRSQVAGDRGPLLKYRVAVEKGITGITANQFGARVVETLSDDRSWVGTGQVRLQRVPSSAKYDFTIYLVTPQTRDTLCGDATRSNPDRYTSCRNGNRVVLNVARWVKGVPKYGASLERYRTYMINHETGHRLGHGHEKCPGRGRKAPVMQQQTLGLHGCTANAWPRVNGRTYQGPAGAYNDPVPDA